MLKSYVPQSPPPCFRTPEVSVGETLRRRNPTHSNTQFQLHEPLQKGIACTISDISGREVFTAFYHAGTQQFQVDLSALPAGLYCYKVDTGLESFFGKIEKQ
jgi:hypothetical protein